MQGCRMLATTRRTQTSGGAHNNRTHYKDTNQAEDNI